MKIKLFFVFVAIGLVTTTGLSLFSVYRYKNYVNSIVAQSVYYEKKSSYLQRCFQFRPSILKNKELFPANGYLVYFSSETCSVCVESLLLMLRNDYKLDETHVTIILDDEKKRDVIISFNDAFKANYKYIIVSKKSLTQVNSVMLVEVDEDAISQILEYSPEEKDLFKEYFKYSESVVAAFQNL